MIDVQKLLGQLLSAQSGRGAAPRHGSPVDARYGAGRPSGGIEGKVGDFLRSPAGAAIAGGIASKFFRGRGLGRMGGSAMKLGGAAAVAGLAYQAWQSWQSSRARGGPHSFAGTQGFGDTLPETAGTPFLPRGEEEHRARLMLSAMIAAAKADGTIDAEEQEAIFGRVEELGLDAEEKGFLMDEMRRPLSIDDLAREARTPEAAVEVYAASLLAIDVDHPAERRYLQRLAEQLRLDPDLIGEIHRTHDAAVG